MSTDRTILLLRHAKSAWGLEVPDHDRPLSGRGSRDGKAVGELLVGRGLVPDLVWCSTALRARQTWERAVTAGARAGRVVYDDLLYEAETDELVTALRRTPPEVATLLVIGHAPAVPDLVERLAPRIDNAELWKQLDIKYRTSGLAVLGCHGPWADLRDQSAQLVDFVVPRGRR
jgi:phosphohistidine phosphatase